MTTSKIIYSIIMTQVFDGETFKPMNWCFSTKEKAFEFYKKLVKSTDKEISDGMKTSDWEYDSNNFEDEKMGTANWERYEEGYYPTNNVHISLDAVNLDWDYDEHYGGNLN